MSTDTPTVEKSAATTDEPCYTYHVEPPAQGGEPYLRCEGCGREVLGTDERRLLHAENCLRRRGGR